MEHVTAWFRESLLCRVVGRLGKAWRESLVCRGFSALGRIIAESRMARWLSSYFHRRFRPRQVLVYRMLRKLSTRLVPVKARISAVIASSLTWRITENSVFLRLASRCLVPISVFFVFIDELGREFFGDHSLFGIWDEIYLVLCVACLILGRIMDKSAGPSKATPMDIPIFLLISVSFFLFLNFSPYPHVGLEGMRGVVQFISWYYVFSRYLDSDRKSAIMTDGLILAGGILGFHGLLQYVVGVEMPSNWMDAAEGTRSVRVFSVVGSPNILGSLMVLIIPMALARALQEQVKGWRRAACLAFLAAMGICLILTLCRGAWLGMAVALTVFCLAWNPKWIGGMVIAGTLCLMIPSVYSRISYMLSDRYIRSSATGGRLLRYRIGWEMFMENLWTGVGQGHFGGAVAMNHKDLFPNTFYMDSYWLKTAVEMGIVGLAAYFIVNWFLIAWSVRAIRTTLDSNIRLAIIGGFSGMTGVLVHNFVENVFEVPYMVIYFWMVAAIVFYNYNRGQFRVVAGNGSG